VERDRRLVEPHAPLEVELELVDGVAPAPQVFAPTPQGFAPQLADEQNERYRGER